MSRDPRDTATKPAAKTSVTRPPGSQIRIGPGPPPEGLTLRAHPTARPWRWNVTGIGCGVRDRGLGDRGCVQSRAGREFVADRGEQRERNSRPAVNEDIRSLVDQGLIETRTIMINDAPERVIVLTTRRRSARSAPRPREEGVTSRISATTPVSSSRASSRTTPALPNVRDRARAIEAEGARITVSSSTTSSRAGTTSSSTPTGGRRQRQ